MQPKSKSSRKGRRNHLTQHLQIPLIRESFLKSYSVKRKYTPLQINCWGGNVQIGNQHTGFSRLQISGMQLLNIGLENELY